MLQTITLTLRRATADDWATLLGWRNDPETRANSHTTDVIDARSHRQWLERVLADTGRTLLIAEEDGVPVGTVRADLEASGVSELSWTVAPYARGRGVGQRMVAAFLDLHPGRYRAEVKQGNLASCRMAEVAGMALARSENGVLHYRIGT